MSQVEIIDLIRIQHRERCFAMEQRKRLDLALGSFLRLMLGWRKDLPEAERKNIASQAADMIDECSGPWGPVVAASKLGSKPFEEMESAAKKEMERLAKLLPVWEHFGESIRGFGLGSLAVIVGEAGDLSNYSTHSKLWKRMGLAVFDGRKQGRVAKGLSKEARSAEFIKQGYSPLRRSRMWNIGDTLMKGNRDGTYRTAYLARKQYERERAEATGLTVAPAAKIPAKRKDEFISEGHIHLRAQRYMEKRLLRDLWKAWRRADVAEADRPKRLMPDAEIPSKDGAEATCALPNSAVRKVPPQQITDAAQAAGQADKSAPSQAIDQMPDHLLPDAPQGAGEALFVVLEQAIGDVPPHQSRDAA